MKGSKLFKNVRLKGQKGLVSINNKCSGNTEKKF